MSPVVTGLAFLLVFGRTGFLGPWLEGQGIQVAFAVPGIVLATLFVTLPYTVREVAYVLEEVGSEEEEAAATLGASGWQIFWRVTLPKIRSGLSYGVLMTLARAVGEFGAVLVVGGGIVGRTQTATTFVHDAVEERDTAALTAVALVLALASVVVLGCLEWLKHRKERTQ